MPFSVWVARAAALEVRQSARTTGRKRQWRGFKLVVSVAAWLRDPAEARRQRTCRSRNPLRCFFVSRRHLVMLLALSAIWGASVGLLNTAPVAVAYGPVVLGEPVRATALGGLALILCGVALGTRTLARVRR
jgi:hypothetical protein